MELKSEKSIKEHLKTLPDDTIIKYYLDVEYTPFPILIIEEYQRRFKRKTKDEILKKLKVQGRLARKKSQRLRSLAKKYDLDFEGISREKAEDFVRRAKKRGFEISESMIKKGTLVSSQVSNKTRTGIKKGIEFSKGFKPSAKKDLELLEKLNRLKKSGVITTKEFNQMKKKILSRI